MEAGRALPVSRDFSVIPAPQPRCWGSALAEEKCSEGTACGSRLLCPAQLAFPCQKGCFSTSMPHVWKKIPPLVCFHLYPPAAN